MGESRASEETVLSLGKVLLREGEGLARAGY